MNLFNYLCTIDDAEYYAANERIANPYGDGTACVKILEAIDKFFA